MPLELLSAELPPPAVGAFTSRAGGSSSGPYAALNLARHVGDAPATVTANRAGLAHALGVPAHALVFAEQVHGAGVAVVDGPVPEDVRGVDALVCAEPGLALVVLAADCLPVVLGDPHAGVVGAAHVGRQGLVTGVLEATVAAMVGLGATAPSITAVLGPAACGRCYELPIALADEVGRRVPGARSTTRQATASVDLLAGARSALHAADVGTVRAVGGCTIEQPKRWFSYRRDGVTGRHGAAVRLA